MERVVVAAGRFEAAEAALAEAVRRLEARLESFSSAREAARALHAGPKSALLVDTSLEGVAALVQDIRSSEDADLLPVLAVVPAASEADAVQAYSMGADDFVPVADLQTLLLPKLRAAIAEVAEVAPLVAGRTVLLADGSQLHRIVLGKLLAQAGFAVTAVTDGTEALDLLERGRTFDLLVIDLGLARVGAIDVLSHFRIKLGTGTPPAIGLVHVGVSDAVALRALTSGFRCVHDKRRPPEDLVFLANETGANAERNLRSSPRLLCSTLVRWRAGGDQWRVGLTHNLSLRGLYVRAMDPPRVGTAIELSLTPPGALRQVSLRAHVAWRKDFAERAVRSYPTGMGVALHEMPARVQMVFEEAARLLASSSGPAADPKR